MTTPSSADLGPLIQLFEDIAAEMKLGFTLGSSDWGTEDEAVAEIEEILRLLRAGEFPERRMECLFTFGGLLDEIEAWTEWGETSGFEARFHTAMARLSPPWGV